MKAIELRIGNHVFVNGHQITVFTITAIDKNSVTVTDGHINFKEDIEQLFPIPLSDEYQHLLGIKMLSREDLENGTIFNIAFKSATMSILLRQAPVTVYDIQNLHYALLNEDISFSYNLNKASN